MKIDKFSISSLVQSDPDANKKQYEKRKEIKILIEKEIKFTSLTTKEVNAIAIRTTIANKQDMFIFLLKEMMYRNETKIKINTCLDPDGIGIPNSCNLSEIIKKKKNKHRRKTLIY